MSTHNLAPHHSELGARLGGLSLGDVGDLLAHVEIATLLVVNTIDLDERGVAVAVTLASVVNKTQGKNERMGRQNGGVWLV